MRKYTLIASLVLMSCGQAVAGPHDDVDNIGRCLVFSYVRAGLDGQKDIPKPLVAGMSFLLNEYEMRAATVGVDEKERQMFIVKALEEQNKIAQVDGMPKLEAQYKTLCANIADTLASEAKSKQVTSKPKP